MSGYKAIMFDLDDTLINRDEAVDIMFSVILENCYSDMPSNEMLADFKIYDNKGYSNKVNLLNRAC